MSVRVVVPVLVVLAVAGSARAAGGGPQYMTAGGAGVAVPDSPKRFVTMPMGTNTLLLRLRRDGGQITGSRSVRLTCGTATPSTSASSAKSHRMR